MRFSVAADLARELGSVLHGYPRFVFSGRAESLARHVPVFVYHGIDPRAFEQDLRFLAENGYRTVGMDDLVRYLETGSIPERAVVLTFDDARSSFWRFGYPMLQRYEMQGVLFVIAGLTPSAPSCRPNLQSVWDGEGIIEDIAAIDPDDVTLCTWPELRHMHASGRVAIESHSLFHKEVFVGDKIVDFLGPDSNYVPFLTPATAYLDPRHVGRPIVPEPLFGLPLFVSAPLHEGRRSWDAPDELRDVAAAVWRELSDDERENGAWRRALRRRWERIDVTRYLNRQSDADVERSVTEDMAKARELIKANVDDAAGEHFCFPYAVGSDLSVRAATRLGIRSCSWGVIPRKKHNAPGDSPMRIGRIKSDFLWRLPGTGRLSLARIYVSKLERRLRGERVY